MFRVFNYLYNSIKILIFPVEPKSIKLIKTKKFGVYEYI
jgi:hypothetical protein